MNYNKHNPLSTKNYLSTSVQENKIEYNSELKTFFWQEEKCEGM